MRREIMIKLKLTAAFALVSAAALGGCTVCVDCEPQSTSSKPLGRQGATYYYSEEWTEPNQDTSADAEFYSSSSEITSTPIATSYQPTYWSSATQPVWQGTSSSAAAYPSYSSSYYPSSSSYYQYQQPAMNRQYAYWPYNSPPELPSAEWQARYIGQQPQTMYYYPPVNSSTNATSGSTSALRRYWASPASSGGRRPIYLGPVWYYP
jgi:hypothetical protein